MKKLKILLSLILFFCSIANFADAQTNSVLPIDFEEIKVQGESVSYLLDLKRNRKVNQLKDEDFKTYERATPNFGFLDGVVWLKIKTAYISSEPVLLELKNPNLDIVQLYVKTKNGYALRTTTGDEFVYAQRERNHRFFQFDITGVQEVLLRIDNKGDQLYIPISVLSESAISERDYKEQYVIGIYYGVILFVFILNLFLYIVIKERANLFYLLYLLGLIFLQLALGGFGFEFLWSDSPFVANHSLPFLATISVLFLVFFVQTFLSTKTTLPKFNKVFNIFIVLLASNLVLSVVPSELAYKLSIVLVNGITLLLNITILPVAYILVRRNFKPARFFLVAFLVLIFFVFGFVLRNFGVAPSNFFTDYSLQIGSALEVILLSFAVVDRFKLFKEDAFARVVEMNELKDRQNEFLEVQVRERTKEVLDQKGIVEQKNKEIIDSINYSKRIQNAIMPSVSAFTSKFKDAFVFFQPKDIVSGDFYWCSEAKLRIEEEESECVVFTVGDCTGHGVPGAIISVLGLRILISSSENPEIRNTGDMLTHLNKEISQLFNAEAGEVQIRDGMDIAVCAYDSKNSRILFSGAKNGIYLVRNGQLEEFKGEKQVIGSENENYHFSFQSIPVLPGDRIYMSSDGFADQFGGVAGKKMKPKLFREEIEKTTHLSMQAQGERLNSFFNTWKGPHYEQTDDVCVVGIEI